MPVFTKPRPSPAMVQPGCASTDYQRAELVNRMMMEAAGALPPAQWLDAAKAALAVADELYPEEVSNG